MWNTRLLISLCLLLSVPAWAQDEVLGPNEDNEPADWYEEDFSGFDCTTPQCNVGTTDCYLEADEDADSIDGVAVTAHSNVIDAQIVFEFPTPASTPSTSTDAQTIKIALNRGNWCQQSGCSQDPDYSLWIECSGVQKTTLTADNNVLSNAELDTYTFTYTPDANCDSAGANLQVRVESDRSAGATRCGVFVEAINWEVTYAGAPPAAGDVFVIGMK